MKIVLTPKTPLSCKAEVIFNSANSFLFHRTGSAKKIRIASYPRVFTTTILTNFKILQ